MMEQFCCTLQDIRRDLPGKSLHFYTCGAEAAHCHRTGRGEHHAKELLRWDFCVNQCACLIA
jgi:hypothetical protein